MATTPEDLVQLLSKLKVDAGGGGDHGSTLDAVNRSLVAINDPTEQTAVVSQLLDNKLIGLVSPLLALEASDELSTKAAELVANITRTDVGREKCHQQDIVQPLITLLKVGDSNTKVQAGRALANICYDSDAGRDLVLSNGGIPLIIDLINDPNIQNNIHLQLSTVVIGLVLNVVNTHEPTQEEVSRLGGVMALCDWLRSVSSALNADSTICLHLLTALVSLSDLASTQSQLSSVDISIWLAELIRRQISLDVSDAALELLCIIAESDAMKLKFSHGPLCSVLVNLLNERISMDAGKAKEMSAFHKSALEFLVLLVTGDDSMENLYSDGNGELYCHVCQWIRCDDDLLQLFAALCIGNFARKDSHCVHMVKCGVSTDLVRLLQGAAKHRDDIRLQHAIISSLRNLTVPADAKPLLIEQGVLESMIAFIHLETFPIVFKLLATLRMLIDKQEKAAVKLGTDVPCIRRIINWSKTEDHLGVQGEASRLLAWLVKHSKSSIVMGVIAAEGGIPSLQRMLSNEHSVMLNEAITALTIMLSSVKDEVVEFVNRPELVSQIHKLLSDGKFPVELQFNVLTFIRALCTSGELQQLLHENDTVQHVTKLGEEKSSPEFSEAVHVTIKTLENSNA